MEVPRPVAALRELIDDAARRSPARLTLLAFASIIAVFIALLSLPQATSSGHRAPFVDSLFTATSSVCITGLTTVNTGTFWSPFGQGVILLGVWIGGLGVMTLASLLGMAVSRRIGLTQRLLTSGEIGSRGLGEVGSIIRIVVITSVTIQGGIAALLVPRFWILDESPGDAVWHGVFYAISAFNNAGFVPTEHGLTPYAGDWWVSVPTMLGVFIGALGFPVILNLAERRRHVRKLTLHSKLTITTSAWLLGVAVVLFGLFEWGNPETLGPLSFGDKILATLFAGVMPRSGGFNTVETSHLPAGTALGQGGR